MTLKEFYKSGQIGYICGANLILTKLKILFTQN